MNILKKTEVTNTINKNNAGKFLRLDHGILFEGVKVITNYLNKVSKEVVAEVLEMLGVFLTIREPNIRYLALDSICSFHQSG